LKVFVNLIIFVFYPLCFASHELNLNKKGYMLEGFDAVSYFKGSQPVKGSPQISTQVDGGTFLFSSEENKNEFLKDPKKFQPQFGGWCAYAVADSKSKVEVDPQSFIIQDGRLLLFYKGIWGQTRQKWLHTQNKNSTQYLKEADSNWPEILHKEP